jgi:hypothetical protein
MSSRIDIAGQRFSRLTVLEEAGHDQKGQIKWLCQCLCGESTIVASRHLRSRDVRSCGCLRREVTSAQSRKQKLKLKVEARLKVEVAAPSRQENQYRRATEYCAQCGATDVVVYFTRAKGNQCEKCYINEEG